MAISGTKVRGLDFSLVVTNEVTSECLEPTFPSNGQGANVEDGEGVTIS